MKDATELYRAMLEAIFSCKYIRQSEDATSPMKISTVEASCGGTFELRDLRLNVVMRRPVNTKWAAANVLHFFAATEKAGVLRKYNKHADKFLTGDNLLGAYGPIAVPQIERCIELLRTSLSSRRAIVSMGGLGTQTVNNPPCWSLLHFLYQCETLNLLVYQRSLNLTGVMPYDCVLLTNVLLYAAEKLEVSPGSIHWTVGSLHMPMDWTISGDLLHVESIVYSADVLSDPAQCMELLEAGA